jgi:hypothetical protein
MDSRCGGRGRDGGCLRCLHPRRERVNGQFGPFTTHLQVWAHGDPLPVIETADSFGDFPRFTYRLDLAEVDQVHAALADAGLPTTTLIPRRIRATRRRPIRNIRSG